MEAHVRQGDPIAPASPDANARGLLERVPAAARYAAAEGGTETSDVGTILRELIPDHARVLDVGCGTGRLAEQVRRGRNVEVVGIEPDAARVALARSRGLAVIHGVADAGTLDAAGHFDVVMLADVLEHVAAPAELLDLAVRQLKPSGRIIASVPNVAHWTVRLALLLGRFEYRDTGIMDATHLRWFTRASVRDLFERCGLEIVSIRATAGTWLPEYHAMPWTLLPRRHRSAAVRRLARRWPGLFACQHVVEAHPAVRRDRV